MPEEFKPQPSNNLLPDFSALTKKVEVPVKNKVITIWEIIYIPISVVYVLLAVFAKVNPYVFSWFLLFLSGFEKVIFVLPLAYSLVVGVFSWKKFSNIYIGYTASLLGAIIFESQIFSGGDRNLIFSGFFQIFDLREYKEAYFYLLPICIVFVVIAVVHIVRNFVRRTEEYSTFKIALSVLIAVGLPVVYTSINYTKTHTGNYQPPALNFDSVNQNQAKVEKERFSQLQEDYPIMKEVENWGSYTKSDSPLISESCQLSDAQAQMVVSRTRKEPVFGKVVEGNQFFYTSADIMYDVLSSINKINEECAAEPISLVYHFPENRVLWSKGCILGMTDEDLEKCNTSANSVLEYYAKLQKVDEPVPLRTSPERYPEQLHEADVIRRVTDWSLYVKSSKKIIDEYCSKAHPEFKESIDNINNLVTYEQVIDGDVVLYSPNIFKEWESLVSKIPNDCNNHGVLPLYQYPDKNIWSAFCVEGLNEADSFKCMVTDNDIANYFNRLKDNP